jgi:hypothetical protein
MTGPSVAQLDAITVELRRLGWAPPYPGYSCGCRPTGLCRHHAGVRAAEHYHPVHDPIARPAEELS